MVKCVCGLWTEQWRKRGEGGKYRWIVFFLSLSLFKMDSLPVRLSVWREREIEQSWRGKRRGLRRPASIWWILIRVSFFVFFFCYCCLGSDNFFCVHTAENNSLLHTCRSSRCWQMDPLHTFRRTAWLGSAIYGAIFKVEENRNPFEKENWGKERKKVLFSCAQKETRVRNVW